MATTTYAIAEYRIFPSQLMKTGYYISQWLPYYNHKDKACSLIHAREPWNAKNIENENVRLLIPFEPGWSYTRDREGVATTVTLPPMGTKLNKKDQWILPLIVEVMLHPLTG
tara:strand:+ start:411 stop:746 length:336 start_codon:yes stop_codon:yes gene_type:complete